MSRIVTRTSSSWHPLRFPTFWLTHHRNQEWSMTCSSISFGAANTIDSGIVLVHNGAMPHVCFNIDLGSAATMNIVTASGVLFLNCTMPHYRFCIVLVVHNGTMPHVRFRIDLRSAATVNIVTGSGVLFHNYTMPHDLFSINLSLPLKLEWQLKHKLSGVHF